MTDFRGRGALVAAVLFAAACSGALGDPGSGPGSSGPSGTGPGGPGGPGGDGAGSGPGKTAQADCTGATTVGPTPLRRLTHQEYDNTVRDLFGVTGSPSSQLEADALVGPFASNFATPVDRLLVNEFMTAGEAIAAQLVTNVDTVVGCDRKAMGDDACAAQFIHNVGAKAYRRPLTSDEEARYTALYKTYSAGEGFGPAIGVVIRGFLQSPHFVYHVEPSVGSDPTPVKGYALASRLSYFLWNSMPDDALFAAAGGGSLDTVEGLRQQAQRMLSSDKARDAIANFASQWMNLSRLDAGGKDSTMFPDFDATLVAAMREETASFADEVIRRGDGTLTTLLTAPWSMIDGPLFSFYGATAPAGHTDGTASKTDLDPKQRAGLLTQASVLAAMAHSKQSSPVLRGKLVRENLLCQPLPDPPANVNTNIPPPTPGESTRDIFLAHENDPSCAGCHKLIDHIGFGFENFDAVGTWRDQDGGKPVDASGDVSGADISGDGDGKFVGAVELASLLAKSNDVRECVAKQWFRFGTGRMESTDDACSIASLNDAFVATGDVRALIVAVVTSDAFRYRKDP